MRTILFALLQIFLVSGILYGYYHLFLRNKRFHQYNRFYLLASVVISVTIPFLRVPVYLDSSETASSLVLQTLTGISSTTPETSLSDLTQGTAVAASGLDWQLICSIIYIVVATVLILKIVLSLLKIRSIINNYPIEKTPQLNFVNTNEPGTPYSFFRWLFWDRSIDLQSTKGQQVFRHELFHIQQKHSADILFLEIVSVIFWINPFFHLMRREIRTIHEFLADRHASQGDNKWEYAELLLMQALNTRQLLTSPFFHNQIKRRIAMITTSKKPSYQYLRKILVLPVALLVTALFAFTYKSREMPPVIVAEKMITVVIDASHGGLDAGTVSPNQKHTEASISLDIAKAIQKLSSEYNVNVIMTRDKDELPRGATSISEGLKNRVIITDESKADALISLHINAESNPNLQKTHSGFEAYLSQKKSNEEGRKLAASLLSEIATIYTTRQSTGSRADQGIFILDKTVCPSVLIECGYITNPDDLEFITNKTNQEKIARKILEGIVKYKAVVNPSPQPTQRAIADTVPDKKGEVYHKVEIEAAFPGGEQKWRKYIVDNANSKIGEQNNAPAGKYTIFVEFKVDTDGTVSGIKPITNHGFGMEKEAERLIAKSPKWLPAINNGKPVASYRKQPFIFVVKPSTAQLLPEVVLVAYASEKVSDVIEPSIANTKPPSTEPGSIEWRKFLERNVSAVVAVNEGWKQGIYKIPIQFTRNIDGSIANVKALAYENSATALHCVKILEQVKTISLSGISPANGVVSFVQPLIVQIENN
jgi:N-acetylmuramoyl-L-alanine amidase